MSVMIRDFGLVRLGAISAIATFVCFVTAVVLMTSSGVDVLIPETGRPGEVWARDVSQADWRFFTGAWAIILMGFLGSSHSSASTRSCARSGRCWSWRRSLEPSASRS